MTKESKQEKVIEKDEDIHFELYLSTEFDFEKYSQLAKSKKNVIILSNNNLVYFIIDNQLAMKDDKVYSIKLDQRHDISLAKQPLQPSRNVWSDRIIAEALWIGSYLPRFKSSLSQQQLQIKMSEYHGISFRYVDVSTDDLKLGMREKLFFKDSLYRDKLKSLHATSLFSLFKSAPELTTTVTERVMNQPSIMTGGCADIKSCYAYFASLKKDEDISGFILIIDRVPADDKTERIKTFVNSEFLLENGIPNPYLSEKEILHRSKQPGRSVDFTDLVIGAIPAQAVNENFSKAPAEQKNIYTNVFSEEAIDLSLIFTESEKEFETEKYKSEFLQKLKETTTQFYSSTPFLELSATFAKIF